MRKNLSFFSVVTSALILLLILASSVFAVSIGPTEKYFTVEPGGSVTGYVNVGNNEKTPYNLTLEVKDYIENLDEGSMAYLDEAAPFGLKNWLTLDKTSYLAQPDEKTKFSYTINVPKNAEPGTYKTALLAGTTDPGEETPSQSVGVAAYAQTNIYLVVSGDYNQELAIEKFDINKGKLLNGEILLEITVKNEGDVFVAPVGTVTIYDSQGEQVKGILAKRETFEGQEVVTSREDEVPVNHLLKKILPNETKTYEAKIENTDLTAGEYTAKLKLYYGDDSTILESDVTFGLDEFVARGKTGLRIDKNFSNNLPINFEVNLHNIGDKSIEYAGYIDIKNAFGITKERIELDSAMMKLDRGENKVIAASWDSSFAMGYYTATLTLNTEEKSTLETISFWVLTWWQILILVVILLLVVFLIYKGISGYSKMKHKMEKLEDEVEHKEAPVEGKKE